MLFLAQFKLYTTDERGRKFVVTIGSSTSNTLIRLVEAKSIDDVKGIVEKKYEKHEVFSLEVSEVLS